MAAKPKVKVKKTPAKKAMAKKGKKLVTKKTFTVSKAAAKKATHKLKSSAGKKPVPKKKVTSGVTKLLKKATAKIKSVIDVGALPKAPAAPKKAELGIETLQGRSNYYLVIARRESDGRAVAVKPDDGDSYRIHVHGGNLNEDIEGVPSLIGGSDTLKYRGYGNRNMAALDNIYEQLNDAGFTMLPKDVAAAAFKTYEQSHKYE